MKKYIILFVLFVSSSWALSGAEQIRMEKIYDLYRTRFIEGNTAEAQLVKMKRLEQTFTSYKNDQRLTEKARTMLTYLAHLFCEARSILDGYVCRDNYNTPGPLTAHKDTYTLTELRRVLLEEHNIRRILRNLGSLRESTILNTIAQNYANDLCEAGYITHELDGSTLGQRYDDGGYIYTLGGENLGSGQTNIAQILDQLTTSIHHRESMYEEKFLELGIGQCESIWVLNYGTPR